MSTLFEAGQIPNSSENGRPGCPAGAFLVPPTTVLNAREGFWQERKRAWLSLGIQSELGRGDASPGGSARPATSLGKDGKTVRGDGVGRELTGNRLTWAAGTRALEDLDETSQKILAVQGGGGTSIFDPVLCELAYRWWSPPSARILDPFAGGSVRGVIAAHLGRYYTGIELRPEQVAANVMQAVDLCVGCPLPAYLCGDSTNAAQIAGGPPYDFIFSCPPYGSLEVYSDNPADLSTMPLSDFRTAYERIIAACCELLHPDRFACFVVGDYRDNKGNYTDFVSTTVRAFERAGLRLYEEAILVTAVGSLSLRINNQFVASRKLGKTHQNVLVFVKGDGDRAAAACVGDL